MLDAHFHLPVARLAKGILCTSRMEEWDELCAVSDRGVIPSLGLLPPCRKADISRLETLLEEHPRIQVGEIGIDARYPDKERQIETFLALQDIAKRFHRMLTLHAVGADGTILSLLDGDQRVLWHGFTGSVETAKAAADKGVVISLSPRLERTRLWKRLDEIADLPFAVESDATDSGKYQELLSEWYGKLAIRLGWATDELEKHARESLKSLFR